MKNNKCKNYHISIEYYGGDVITRYTEYHQRLRLFKKVEAYGNDKLVVCSSAWFEYELTIKNQESQYFVMLSNGQLMHIGFIDENVNIDKVYGDECVILKISNFEVLN